MPDDRDPQRDLKRLLLPETGALIATGDAWEPPYRLVDMSGAVVEPVAVYLKDLLASDSSPLTLRSYGMDLLRW